MEVIEQESEEKRVARLKELEDLVKKLKNENKQLLNKVNGPGSASEQMAVDLQKKGGGLDKAGNRTSRGGPLSADDLDTQLLDFEESEREAPPVDEWLFVSPKLPPTPAHKKMSPAQWLSEGHNRNRETDVPSLSDVRKTLVFSMDEAENLVNASRVVPGAESPPTSPSLSAKHNPSNRTTQKYLHQARQQHNSPPSSHSPLGGESPTLGIRPTSNGTRQAAQVRRNNAGSVPVVKWTPKVPSESPPPLSDEDVEEIPKGRWNVRQVPSNNQAIGGGGGDSLKVKWDPSMANDFSSDEEETQQGGGGRGDDDVPVVKWNAKLPKDSRSGNAKHPAEAKSGGGDVPVIKWQPKVPKVDDGGVPVVKNWRAKAPAENPPRNEDVPVVKWPAAKMPPEAEPRGEDVPVIKWPAAKVPAAEDVPVVKWQARSPNSSGAGSPSQKRSLGSPRGRGRGLAPPSRRSASAHDESENSEEGVLNGESEFSGSEGSMDNLRVSRYSAHQSGLQRRGHSSSSSRSPQTRNSPRMTGGQSGSPSPPEGSSPRLQNSHVSRSGLAAPRQGASPLRNLSPSSQNSQASAKRSPSSSPGRGLKAPRGQLQPSASAPTQRSPPGGSGGGKPPSGLTNSRGLQAPRAQQATASSSSSSSQQTALRGSSSAPSAVRSGLTPPTGGQGKSRQLPAVPRPGGNGGRGQPAPSQLRVKQAASAQKQSPKRANQQRVAQHQAPSPAAGDDDDSWLEGCF